VTDAGSDARSERDKVSCHCRGVFALVHYVVMFV
jgi:hypothetical protein